MRIGVASLVVLTALGCGQTSRNPGAGDDVAGTGGSVAASGGGAAGGGVGGGGSAVGGGGASTVICEPLDPEPVGVGDPGAPGTQYGPLMGGSLIVEGRELESLGTAAAVAGERGSHLFYITRPTDELPLVYISIYVADHAWSPGVYSRAFAGKLEVTTRDGCSYQLRLDRLEPDSSFLLDIAESHQQGTDFYLRGRLDAELPSRHGLAPISLHFTIN